MLRLMTLNLNYRLAKHGVWDARRDLVADAVRRTRADVIALQAVEAIDDDNQAEELARILDYPHVTFAAAMTDGGTRRGSAFVSRRPLEEFAVRSLSRLTRHEDTNDRVVLRAKISSGSQPLTLYNAHFSWVLPQALDNAREMLDFNDRHPAVVLGDLNSAPDSPALTALCRAGWVDLWQALRADETGYTFEADWPTMRIDYALASADVRSRVESIDLVGVRDTVTPRLSDHLGLLVSMRE